MTEEDFPFSVTEEEDGSITLAWDRTHPLTSIFNDWTKDDFEQMIIDACTRTLKEHGK